MKTSDGKAAGLMPRHGGGKSSVVKGPATGVLAFGVKDGDKSAGTKRFDVTNRSLNRGGSRKM